MIAIDKATVKALASVTRRIPDRPFPKLDRWLRGAISRAPRLTAVRAPYGDLTLSLDLRDNLQREVFYRGRYESTLHAVLLAELRRDDVFVDVGANIGIHALPVAGRLADLGGGQVLAFEAAPDTARSLQAAAHDNGIAFLEVIPVALGAEVGTLELRSSTSWGPGDTGVRSLYGEGATVASVPVIPFDQWRRGTATTRVDVVKIDVEGAELDVLRGMTRSFRTCRPRLVVVEVVDSLLVRAGSSAVEVERFFSEHGYVPDGPGVMEVARSGNTGPLWPNVLLRPAERAR